MDLNDFPTHINDRGLKSGDKNVIDSLIKMTGNDIITKNNYSINNNDFDYWTSPINQVRGVQKDPFSDSAIDVCMIVWRVNNKVHPTRNNSGNMDAEKFEVNLKDSKFFMDMARFVSWNSTGWEVMQHELAHSLMGSDNFHIGAGGETRVTMNLPGGYSILSMDLIGIDLDGK